MVVGARAGRPTDAELVARCIGGEATAWDALVDRYARYVHAILRRAYGLQPDAADDVFQEVFVRIYERLQTLRDGAAVRSWIAQLTRRAAIDALRRSERELALSDTVAALWVEDPDWLDRLDTELSVRFYLRDESYHVIARELGVRDGTVASRLSRALTRLQGLLGRTELAQPSSSTSPSY